MAHHATRWKWLDTPEERTCVTCEQTFMARNTTRQTCGTKCEARRNKLWLSYKLTPAEHRALLTANPDCNLCGRPLTKPCTDHDHETGAVRGILCVGCNSGLGKLGDTPEGLDAAQRYLLAHRDLLGELLAA